MYSKEIKQYRASELELAVIDRALDTMDILRDHLLEGTSRVSPEKIASVLSLVHNAIIEVIDEIRYRIDITLTEGEKK